MSMFYVRKMSYGFKVFTRELDPIQCVEIASTSKTGRALTKVYDRENWIKQVYKRYLPAVTAPSYNNFSIIFDPIQNQVIEDVGDKILNAAVTITIFQPPYALTNEGSMTEVRNRLVNTLALSEMGILMGIDKLIGVGCTKSLIEDTVECMMYVMHSMHGHTNIVENFISSFYAIHDPIIDPSKPYFTLFSSYALTRPYKCKLSSTTRVYGSENRCSYRFNFLINDVIEFSCNYDSIDMVSEKLYRALACQEFLESRSDLTEFKTSQLVSKIRSKGIHLSDLRISEIQALHEEKYFVEYDVKRHRLLIVQQFITSPQVEFRNSCACVDLQIEDLSDYLKLNHIEPSRTKISDSKMGLTNKVILLTEGLKLLKQSIEDPIYTRTHGLKNPTKALCVGQSSTKMVYLYFVPYHTIIYEGNDIPDEFKELDVKIIHQSLIGDVKRTLQIFQSEMKL